MENLYLYVAETYHPGSTDKTVTVKSEITPDELEQLNAAFAICGIYNSITQIKDIVVENGTSFKRFMKSQNLQELRKQNVSPERLITLANKSVLNYASSIKTYIDMETRILKKRANKEALEQFKTLQHSFYDGTMEYRFWVNFRNYIVHCEFPYSIFHASVEDGYKIICTKERLLQFDNWKHSRADIENLDDQIDLTAFVDEMSSLIFAFYIDFFSYFAQDIVSGINVYGEFCKKYDVRVPVIFKTKTRNQVAGSSLQPLPIKELQEAFNILRSNLHIKINFVK